MAEKPAPFIPASPEETGLPPAFWRVFGTRSFFKLWIAQVVSSLGDWIGIIAILAIAARVSGGSGAAVSLVMVARVVPGFFLATVGGVIVDRFDRRRVMVLVSLLQTAGFDVERQEEEPFAQTIIAKAAAMPCVHRLPSPLESRRLAAEISASGLARPA